MVVRWLVCRGKCNARSWGGGELRNDENALHSAPAHDICRDVFATTRAPSFFFVHRLLLPILSLLPDPMFRFDFNGGKCTPCKVDKLPLSIHPSGPFDPPSLRGIPFAPSVYYAYVACPRADTGAAFVPGCRRYERPEFIDKI